MSVIPSSWLHGSRVSFILRNESPPWSSTWNSEAFHLVVLSEVWLAHGWEIRGCGMVLSKLRLIITENIWLIFFLVKLTFEMLTVRGQQHSFSTHERMFLWKCQSFWDRKCLDLWGTRTPNLRIYAEGSNHLSCQGQTFSVPCFFDTGSCSKDIF